MILLIAALGTARFASTNLFDACVSHLKSMGSYTAHITVHATAGGKREDTTFDVAVKGTDVLMRIREPATSTTDHSDRSYQLIGDKLVAYDAVAGEWLQRPSRAKDAIDARMMALMGPIDDAVLIALKPSLMQRFFDRFKNAPDWRVKKNNGYVSVARYSRAYLTEFRFTEAPTRLMRVYVHEKNGNLVCEYAFKPGADVNLRVPRGATKVASFTVREAPPKYLSPEAKQIVNRMLEAYRQLKFATVHVESGGLASTLYLSNRKLREDRPTFVWAYDGAVLTMHDLRSGKFYSGKAIRPILSEYITMVGGEVDPLIIRIAAKKVPYEELLPMGGTVKVVGTAGDGWKKSDILDVASPTVKVSMFIRQNNHLLDSLSSEIVDRRGRVQSRGDRHFSYEGIGSPPKDSLFRLSAGNAKILPLPDVNGNPTKIHR